MPLINYSKQALKYGNTLRLCDNFCGTWIYFVPWQPKPLNAEESKKDSLHEDTCSKLLDAKMMLGALNWFPDGVFLVPLQELIRGIVELESKELTIKQFLELIDRLYKTAINLDGSIRARQAKNEAYRAQWKKEKERKKAGRTNNK